MEWDRLGVFWALAYRHLLHATCNMPIAVANHYLVACLLSPALLKGLAVVFGWMDGRRDKCMMNRYT